MQTILKKHKRWCLVFIVFLILIVWTFWGNITIKTTRFDIYDSNLPAGFEGYCIAQISDLHNAEFGKDNARLISILQKEKPDIIVLTGDLVDSNHTDLDIAVSFVEQAMQIAPCYYVTGNHEAWLRDRYTDLEQRLQDCGVAVLRNQTVPITANGDTAWLIGIDDPDFVESGSGMFDLSAGIISTEIDHSNSGEGYKILLSHRPEVFSTYVDKNMNLAFCGHAHGGQFRLPFIGGLVAPNQGLFPNYDAGIYHEHNTTMIVSRGIGNSIIPIRFNNRPEVVIAVLHR